MAYHYMYEISCIERCYIISVSRVCSASVLHINVDILFINVLYYLLSIKKKGSCTLASRYRDASL